MRPVHNQLAHSGLAVMFSLHVQLYIRVTAFSAFTATMYIHYILYIISED